MHMAQEGIAGGTPVLLLHAAGFAGSMWRPLTTELADLQLLIPDLPGHGQSIARRFTSFENTADALVLRLQELGVSGPVHVAGISLGAYVGMLMALRHPEWVRSAFLSGFHVGNMPKPGFMRIFGDAISPIAATRWFRRRMVKSMGVPDGVAIADELVDARTNGRTIRTVNRAAIDFDQRANLGRIRSPVLAIAGGREHALIRDSLKIMACEVKACHARLVPETGHAWPIQDPDLFARTLRAWLNGKDLPGDLETVKPSAQRER